MTYKHIRIEPIPTELWIVLDSAEYNTEVEHETLVAMLAPQMLSLLQRVKDTLPTEDDQLNKDLNAFLSYLNKD